MTADDWLDKRLTTDDQRLLARQGYVAAERLPSGRLIYKLRFRDASRRQRVLYVGGDARLAGALEQLLGERQAQRRVKAELRRAMAAALAAQRQARAALAPQLAAHGYRFHGFHVRRTRGCASAVPQSPRCRDRAGSSIEKVIP
jgi:hypothetical protein